MNTTDIKIKNLQDQCQRMSEQLQHYTAKSMTDSERIKELEEELDRMNKIITCDCE